MSDNDGRDDHILRLTTEIDCLRKQLSESQFKATKYDDVVKALQVCDGGRYRNDTIESVIIFAKERDKLTAEVATLKQALAESEEGRKRHEAAEAAVGRFLSDMYCTLIDPLADGQMKVAEMCKVLLEEAVKQRQRECELINEVSQWESRFRIAVEQMQSARNGKWSADQQVQRLTAELEKSVERYGESYVIRDQLRQALEAAKGALKRYSKRGNWHCARRDGPVDLWICCDEKAWNGPDAATAALAQIESLTPSAEGEPQKP